MTIVYSIQKTVVLSSYSIYHSDTNLNNGKSIQYKLIQLEWEIPFEFIIPHIGFCLLLLIWKRLHLYVELSASTVNKKSICTRATFIWRNSARWTAMFLNATVATIVVALPLHYKQSPVVFSEAAGKACCSAKQPVPMKPILCAWISRTDIFFYYCCTLQHHIPMNIPPPSQIAFRD